MFNQNELQSQLNNALQRITQLENVNISPGINNQSSISSGNELTLAQEMRRSFPSLAVASLRNSTASATACFPNSTSPTPLSLTHTSATTFGVNRRKRKQRGSTPKPKANIKPKAVLKDLVLLADPSETSVPTHSTRVMLESGGYVVHSFPFVREWDGVRLRNEIENVFPQLKENGYEYMKVSTIRFLMLPVV